MSVNRLPGDRPSVMGLGIDTKGDGNKKQSSVKSPSTGLTVGTQGNLR
ncbi:MULTISPECIES: hypothetical protein [unclassified Synechocystis]|nr:MULTISPECIES: hypothetical protein [unclassified Synechocystis]AIE75420.1 hypothetical protein D082_28920 [Synechocystis sp. PCC 6714]MCT0253646.1 hypothetical protein [Synechocystis sp. CS-94]